MPSDLTKFGLGEMLTCSLGIRKSMDGALSMETAAQRACRYLYEELVGAGTGLTPRACILARCYKTHPIGALDPELRRFARGLLGGIAPPPDNMRCLTLLGSVGDEPRWNSRQGSAGHKAIPLASPDMVARAPMIAQMIRDFGVELDDVLHPRPAVPHEQEGRTYGVFHVEEARGSAAIPAQTDFVLRHGVRSVVGFGGSLVTGDMFAMILFTRVPVTTEVASRFRTLALDLKTVFLRYNENQVFERRDSTGTAAIPGLEVRR